MHFHIAAELLNGSAFGFRCLIRLDGVPCLQRKLRVDDERRRIVRHLDGAVRPVTVRKRRLKLESAGGKGIGDQNFHACLSKGAARLLVGKDGLQSDHVLGQILNIALRGVDDREALLQSAQIFMGRPGLFRQCFANALRHAVEALVERLAHLGLAGAERFRHGRDTAMQFGLCFQKIGDFTVGSRFFHAVCRDQPGCDQTENQSREQRAEADIDGAGPQRGIKENGEIYTHD
ncbi:hypothetical protein D3C86_1032500 [compost metagenome]